MVVPDDENGHLLVLTPHDPHSNSAADSPANHAGRAQGEALGTTGTKSRLFVDVRSSGSSQGGDHRFEIGLGIGDPVKGYVAVSAWWTWRTWCNPSGP